MFMAAFVLSVYVYVYLRSKEGCLAQASFVGVLWAKPEKKARNRKEEYEGKEEYEAYQGSFLLDKQAINAKPEKKNRKKNTKERKNTKKK